MKEKMFEDLQNAQKYSWKFKRKTSKIYLLRFFYNEEKMKTKLIFKWNLYILVWWQYLYSTYCVRLVIE